MPPSDALETKYEIDEDDFLSDDESESNQKVFDLKTKSKARRGRDVEEEEGEEEEEDNEERSDDGDSSDEYQLEQKKEAMKPEDENDEEDIEDEEEEARAMLQTEQQRNTKLKKLSPGELAKEQARIKRTGVCYLSKIPPYMKPQKLRSILTRFGAVDRLFLKPEDATAYHRRVKYGGNKKKKYTEGWIEFVNKSDAKLCAATLNGNKLGGKKTSYYYDDVINIKYLKGGFKWHDLTQQIARENEVRQARLALELSQQNKFNKAFVNNVEKSKMIGHIQKKRGKTSEDGGAEDGELRRNFKQRKVNSSRSDANHEVKGKATPNDKLNSVLSKVL
ncbi:uncharacterized protein LODBEIA_P55040 [Lodderomyces beijingensis]|uniref:Pre-rRNA-processing protein ESF2 n=1 Tax=Lodderomyces beijingensis TaxID=1775926 RepID=A0ABP0ZWJ7_9ASCO